MEQIIMEQLSTLENRNQMKLEFPSKSENEAFARTAVAAFVAQLDPTVEELTEIKTAVSEAVSNAVIHAYQDSPSGMIVLECMLKADRSVVVTVTDFGVGIDDIRQAMQPLFTSKSSEERSGMGFTVMESFMDKISVTSEPGMGTKVNMMKSLDMNYEF